ncbi:hypothetical protein [Bordetella flabilis]|uniref:Uncharacterized protein n=1 Tax=Bordetella flabilis TaxID=463014 RepID=A0A193GE66_9BORD|nr:hypothetical protein [Bordetella flabilis]ANN77584.1 hypothetical protein BAU07_11120 [Bordetella flabilis]
MARLRELLIVATKSPQAKAFFANSATESWTSTPSELSQFQTAERAQGGLAVKAAGIEPE